MLTKNILSEVLSECTRSKTSVYSSKTDVNSIYVSDDTSRLGCTVVHIGR